MKIRVGSRESRLAVIQAEMVMAAIAARHPQIEMELITMKTTGDVILDRTLDKIGGKGLFVKELDAALLAGNVDITVHSFKDMPMEVDERLPIVAVSGREDPRDALVLPEGSADIDLSKPIGCSSARRQIQLTNIYPGAEVASVRGNVQTRLRKLDEGQYSAVVLAMAGLKRLGLENRVSRVFDPVEMLPSACQGIIAVQARAGFDVSFLDGFNDQDAWDASAAERAFVAALNGGCSSPVAAYAELSGDRLTLTGLYVDKLYAARKHVISGDRKNGAKLGRALAEEMLKMARGKVYLVGAGPGDAGLLTVKAAEALKKADVVVFDRLVGEGVLAQMPETAEKIDVGKHAGRHPVPQDDINRILLDKALEGKLVVRLKGGDPFLFGRGGEELELLKKRGVAFEVVPGVTSAIAAAAYAGIPVTHRDFCSSLHIITGHAKEDGELHIDYPSLVKLNGTLVFMMSVSNVAAIAKGLIEAGLPPDTEAAVVENGTKPGQRKFVGPVSRIAAIVAENGVKSPAAILVGKVCSLSESFDWFSKLPLKGCRVLVTRPLKTAGKLSGRLSELGARVTVCPCIETHPIAFDLDISGLDWVIFTSAAGVESFFDGLFAKGLDSRALCCKKIAAVGAETAKELVKHGIRADFVPSVFDGAHLAQELLAGGHISPGQKAGLFRAKIGSEDIGRILAENNVSVADVAVYETMFVTDHDIHIDEFDYAAFTSASCVHGFTGALGPEKDFSAVNAVCIGEQTAAAAREAGMNVAVSETATVASMADRIVELYKRGNL